MSTPALRWREFYSEAELYKAAVRLYTKPLFSWRKALSTSSDGLTLYDFARRGLRNLDALHQDLSAERFHFRPGLALHYNFNGKNRTLYVYPWEERLVDLLLYRLLNARLQHCFSPHSYAYRPAGFGVDVCQRRIARQLSAPGPLYLLKRDIRGYFDSIDHNILLAQLERFLGPRDYLHTLLLERIRFSHQEGVARRGVPFGTAIACFFANLYLTDLDHKLSEVCGLRYFRYADDFLAVASRRSAILEAGEILSREFAALRLASKPSHALDLVYSKDRIEDERFSWSCRLRHLGLEYRASAPTRLSRDKARKIMNLFRYAFRRQKSRLDKLKDPFEKARRCAALARGVLETGVRNVALIDYYLKHVDDEAQLQNIDRWLAEEVLSIAFGGGHRKGRFGKLGFKRLRALGLPSLVHRRRLIRHGHIESSFFIWKSRQASRGSMGTAARPQPQPARAPGEVFSPLPEAAAGVSS